MKRTNLKNGVQERINYLIGTNDTGDVSNVDNITPWSVQASMIENTRRAVRAMVGNTAKGRVMKGLAVSQSGGTPNITITPGIGFTPDGDIVQIPSATTVTKALTDQSVGGENWVYIKYVLKALDVADGGRESAIIGGSSNENIVYDEHGAASPGDGASISSTIIEISSSVDDSGDKVFLAKVTVNADTPSWLLTVEISQYQNFEDTTGNSRIPGDAYIGGSAIIGAGAIVDGGVIALTGDIRADVGDLESVAGSVKSKDPFEVDGVTGITQVLTVASLTTITVTGGLITGTT